MRRRPGTRATFMLAAAIAAALGLAATATAQDAVADTTAGRTASLIFLDSWNRTVMPISVAELRVGSERRAESMLLAAGRRVARTEAVVELAWRHRVRTGQSISPVFLEALATQLQVTELVVVQLIVEPSRLVLLARSLDTGTAVVRRVWIEEVPIEPLLLGADPELEQRGLTWALARGFGAFSDDDGMATSPPRSPVVMLPVYTVGCGVIESLMATHTLLAGFVHGAEVPLVDPAVVVATLQMGGHDPTRVGAAARRYLADEFEVDRIASPEMMAYDTSLGRPARAVRDDTDFTVGPRSTVQSFTLTLRRIDLRDGAVSPGGDVHVQHLDRIGWFGHVDDTSLLRRLQQASDSLWNEFRAHLEDT